MSGLIHEVTKTDSQNNIPRRNSIAAMALLIFCLEPLAAQETNHPEIVVDVKTEELNIQPVAANWPSYNGDYTGQRFSSLDQLNQANVSQLRVAWVFHSPHSRDMEVTPVVVNGLMLVTYLRRDRQRSFFRRHHDYRRQPLIFRRQYSILRGG
jgi:glucose dehydrogenase